MVVSTRRSSFSVPPLPVPHTYESASGNNPPAIDRKKARSSNAHCPPRPPTSRKLQRTGSTPLTTTRPATTNVGLLQNSRIPPASRDLDRMMVESPSESDTTSTMSAHFLQGINVEKCLDVLSIPDPPTPTTTEKLRKKRRQSTPFILDAFKFKENDDNIILSVRNSRSRKSLGHLPFLQDSPDWTLPLDTKLEWKEAMGSGKARTDSGLREVTNSFVNTPVAVDSEWAKASRTSLYQSPSRNDRLKPPTNPAPSVEKEAAQSLEFGNGKTQKRQTKKRRDSIVFPVDLFVNETLDSTIPNQTEVLTEVSKCSGCESFESIAAVEQAQTKVLESEESTFDWEQIGNLIREFISLSPSSRIKSAQAARIEAITGYPLIPPSQRKDPTASVDLNWSSSPQHPVSDAHHVDSQRRSHFMKHVAPNMQKLEKMKDQEDKEIEFRTNTRVQKVKFKYHYYDISTGRRIPSEQYKQRYMAMLQENEALEHAKTQVWLAGLPTCQEIDHFATKPDEENRQKSPQKPPMADAGEDMEVCATEPTMATSSDPSIVADCEELAIQPPSASAMACPRALPLPDKDRESSDPDIARAERKLWAAMDAALEAYSAEVLAIMKAKENSIATELAEF